MRSQKCSVDLYVGFLIASQRQYSGAELSRVAPAEMAHDAVSRWLSSQKLTPKIVWQHAAPLVNAKTGYLILDDTVLDKPYSRATSLVKARYSGKHHRVVSGIDLVNMLWTDGEKVVPVDYRAYDPTRDGKTKNDHAQEMLDTAEKRGFSPEYVLLDSWYSSIANLKTITRNGWKWIAELKANRLVSVVQGTYLHVSDLDWASTPVHQVWLKAYGFVRVSEIVFEDGDIAYIATNDLSLLNEETIKSALRVPLEYRVLPPGNQTVLRD